MHGTNACNKNEERQNLNQFSLRDAFSFALMCHDPRKEFHLINSNLRMTNLIRERGGGGIPIHKLYRYVPRNRVWFLRFSVLK